MHNFQNKPTTTYTHKIRMYFFWPMLTWTQNRTVTNIIVMIAIEMIFQSRKISITIVVLYWHSRYFTISHANTHAKVRCSSNHLHYKISADDWFILIWTSWAISEKDVSTCRVLFKCFITDVYTRTYEILYIFIWCV